MERERVRERECVWRERGGGGSAPKQYVLINGIYVLEGRVLQEREANGGSKIITTKKNKYFKINICHNE